MSNPKTESSAKKPYTPPKLVIYGDVQSLTLASASGSNNDGGVRPMVFSA